MILLLLTLFLFLERQIGMLSSALLYLQLAALLSLSEVVLLVIGKRLSVPYNAPDVSAGSDSAAALTVCLGW